MALVGWFSFCRWWWHWLVFTDMVVTGRGVCWCGDAGWCVGVNCGRIKEGKKTEKSNIVQKFKKY